MRKAGTRENIWAALWPYVLRHRKLLLVTVVLAPTLSVLNLSQPYLLKVALDEHILVGHFEGLMKLGILYLGIFLLEYVLNFAQVVTLQLAGQKIMRDLRSDLFQKTSDLEPQYFDRTPVGVTLTRLTTDCESISELFASGIVSLAWDLLRLVLTVSAMLWLDWRLTLVAFSVLPVLWGIVRVSRRLLERSYQWVREKVAAVNVFLQEHISGMRIVQLFHQEERSARTFAQLNQEYRDANMSAVRYDAMLYAAVEAIGSFAIGLMIWYGAGRMIQGVVTLGVLVAFIEYISRFFVPIRDLSAKYAIIQSARVSLQKILELLDRPVLITSPKNSKDLPPSWDRLQFENVCFSYDGNKNILENVSFGVRRGERVAIVGLTGSGKSTIFKLMNRSYDVRSGSVRLSDVDIRDLRLRDLRQEFCLIPQDVFLFRGTVEENIRLFEERFSIEDVRESLRTIQADDLEGRFPQGLKTEVGARGSRLSLGERQVIAMARALLFKAPFLLLDEATAHVDPRTSRLLSEAVDALHRNHTLLVIAHRLETVRKMDRILVLHHGQVVESGTHEELMKQGGLYQTLARVELRVA